MCHCTFAFTRRVLTGAPHHFSALTTFTLTQIQWVLLLTIRITTAWLATLMGVRNSHIAMSVDLKTKEKDEMVLRENKKFPILTHSCILLELEMP